MIESVQRTSDEVKAMFDRLDKIFDAQCRAIKEQNPDLDAAGLIVLKKLEMDSELAAAIPTSAELAANESQWNDGYCYGLLRGYWRAINWLIDANDISLLDQKD